MSTAYYLLPRSRAESYRNSLDYRHDLFFCHKTDATMLFLHTAKQMMLESGREFLQFDSPMCLNILVLQEQLED
jgi:hypothetical protein